VIAVRRRRCELRQREQDEPAKESQSDEVAVDKNRLLFCRLAT
jgi:hypothetical protein